MILAPSGFPGGPLGALLGRLGGLLGRLEAVLGRLGSMLGHLGGLGGLPGPSWEPSWASWRPWRTPGRCRGDQGPSGGGGDARTNLLNKMLVPKKLLVTFFGGVRREGAAP